METTYGTGFDRGNRTGHSSIPIGKSECDRVLTLEDRKALTDCAECVTCRTPECSPFLIPWENGPEHRKSGKRSAMIDVGAYVVVGAAVLASVVLSSLPVFMLAIIAAGFYIVISHSYDEALKAEQSIEEKNYQALLSPGVHRN